MKILVVDDEKDTQTLFEQRFRRETKSSLVEFVFAFSGEEALEYLKILEHEAVLILSDINKKFLTPPPIVMMITAYGDAENLRMAKQLGADDFLTKPVNFIELKQKLNLPN
jgi:two-component system, chemotaxis family, chemotaxis protein CheY